MSNWGAAMPRVTSSVGLLMTTMVAALLVGGIPAQASSEKETTDTRAVIRPNAKCAKANAKVTVVIKGKTLQCKKSKRGYFWRVIASPSDANASNSPTTPVQRLRVIPDGGNNALFTMNQRFLPEIAQTLTLERPISLESLTLDPRCITLVPLTYYSGQDQDHSLEEFTCSYPDISTTVTTSIYKISDQFIGHPSRFLLDELTRVSQKRSEQVIRLESPFRVDLDPAVELEPGYYAIVFGFELTDPNINTIWFGGHQHNDGPQPACVGDPISDIYALGSAYRGEPDNTYTGLADNYRGSANLFIMHTAKVQSCIVVGNYVGDVFANGDINLVLEYRTRAN